MTQAAGPHSVLGDFNGASHTFRGVTSRFTRDGDAWVIETLGADGVPGRFEVAMTVGSRRIQQYVARVGDRHVRLPLAWDIQAGRWFHLNGGFLHPDGSDFNTHTALWNANCIFCHNVKARPAFDPATQRFESQVAEHGIACEACHGPGAEHAQRNGDPLRRYLLYMGPRRDPTMTSPLELTKEHQVQICGHCHGQRTPKPLERIREFMTDGDPYTAGDDLSQYTSPVWMDTRHEESPLEATDFSLRFWKDGTPRLTAYEYQATLQSACYARGELTCSSCHTMHGGDVRGQITAEKRGPGACLPCHRSIGADVPAHTRHGASSPGSDCYACHMPRIVYGSGRCTPRTASKTPTRPGPGATRCRKRARCAMPTGRPGGRPGRWRGSTGILRRRILLLTRAVLQGPDGPPPAATCSHGASLNRSARSWGATSSSARWRPRRSPLPHRMPVARALGCGPRHS
jgi:predicted CXXCH cytochrome family protein